MWIPVVCRHQQHVTVWHHSPSTRQASKTIASFQQRSWMMNSWKERCNLVDRKPPKLPKLPAFQGIDDKPPVEETHLTGIYQGSWKLVAFHSQRGPVFRRVMMTLKELCGAHFCGFTPISSDTKGATSASGETRQYRDIGTGLESPKSTWEDHCWRMVMCFDLCDSASFRFKSYELCWSKKINIGWES